MKILQVSTTDDRGGAAVVAGALHAEFRRRGLKSWMAVGTRHTKDPNVFVIPNEASGTTWTRSWNRAASITGKALANFPGGLRVERALRDLGSPAAAAARRRGSEDFDFPGTWKLPELTPESPDLLQLHNLHGGYFDLRALPVLTGRFPTALTLHDAWMLSGHCAHSFDCGRWETGCGACPDLSILPAIARDDTAANWERKRAIYAAMRVYVISPSAWLLRKVEHSMLAQSAIERVVIPNGVDHEIFHAGSSAEARKRLGLPLDAKVVLFAANGVRNNPWKDYRSLRQAVGILGERSDSARIIFLALGEAGNEERLGNATIRFVPFNDRREEVADFYRAADLYMHAARVDTFPNTIIEALSCGTPVVATGVGGIPEQIHALDGSRFSASHPVQASEATGIVVEPGDGEALAAAGALLLDDDQTRLQLGRNAARDSAARFSIKMQVDAYIALYSRMLENAQRHMPALGKPGTEDFV